MTLGNTKRSKHALWAGAGLVVVALIWHQIPFLHDLEQLTLDFRYAHFNRSTPASTDVVVIDIDEQSLKLLSPSLGRWPWPRHVYTELLEFVSLGEPAAILFDLLFTEAMKDPSQDRQLRDMSVQLPNISHAMNLMEGRSIEGSGVVELPNDFDKRFGIHWTGNEPKVRGSNRLFLDYVLPAPIYYQDIPNIHVVSFPEDADGLLRRAPLFFKYGDQWLPSLALKAILAKSHQPTLQFENRQLVISPSDKPSLAIALDRDGALPLHFYKRSVEPKSIPLAPIIASAIKLQRGEVEDPAQLKVNPLEFAGKVVLIGASAVGLDDLKVTPIHSAFPGANLHATAISNILSRDFLHLPSIYWQWFATLFLISLIYHSLFFLSVSAIRYTLPFLIVGGYLYLAIWLFQSFSIGIGVAMPLTLSLLAIVEALGYANIVERAEKRRAEGTLTQYLSPDVAKQLISEGANPAAEVGRLEELSILFSDIRGFTTIAEKTEPHLVVAQLNEYLGAMTDVVFDHTGTLDKFIGDAIMAFWGAPLTNPSHALCSVQCALAMQKALKELNQNWIQTSTNEPLTIGVGIHTGKVIVGNIGSNRRLDYTVIGDNVNLSSRLEGLTKQYGVGILVSEATRQLVEDHVLFREIDRVQVKGKLSYISVFEPLGMKDDLQSRRRAEQLQCFEAALKRYREGAFNDAKKMFETALTTLGEDPPCHVYIQRCIAYLENPPAPNWNGVFVAASK